MSKISHGDLLAALTQQRHRKKSKNRGYGEEIKTLVRKARRSGLPVSAIAQATGISPHTIYAWLASDEKPLVEELKIVDAPSPPRERLIICLPSGLRIEVG